MKSLSDQVRAAMIEASKLGVTRYRLAQAVGLTQSAMTRFANGGGGIQMATLDRIAAVLGLTVKLDRVAVRRLAADAAKRRRSK